MVGRASLRLGVLGAIITLGGVASAVGPTAGVALASWTDPSICQPLAAARAKAAVEHPGVLLPTRLPPIGYACLGIRPFGPSVYQVTFTKGKPAKRMGYLGCDCLTGMERTAFAAQFWVWRGHRTAEVLKWLAGHVAKPFTAGRYKGTIAIPVPTVGDYVWESGQFTYLFTWNTAPGPPGYTPLTVIASFTAPVPR